VLELSLSSRGAVGDGPLNEEHLNFMRRERAQVLGSLRRTSRLLTYPIRSPSHYTHSVSMGRGAEVRPERRPLNLNRVYRSQSLLLSMAGAAET
jgi:hypothetical protein